VAVLEEGLTMLLDGIIDFLKFCILEFGNMLVTIFTLLFILSIGAVICGVTLSSLLDLWKAIGKKDIASILILISKIIILVILSYPIFWLLSGGLTEDWWHFWR
jgi:hypothetical protein